MVWLRLLGTAALVVTGKNVQVVRTPAVGAEAGLPRGGAYDRGVALDAAGDHASALREYSRALVDLDSLSDYLGASGSCRAAWRGKIGWQRERSEELLEQEAYAAVTPGSSLAHANLATAYHHKYLAVRARLAGDAHGMALAEKAAALAERAEAEYGLALELDRRNGHARAGLAGLRAQVGRTDAARREMAILGKRAAEPALLLRVAAYHAALGDLDAAFAALADVPANAELGRALWSNEFDPLRADPRFAELVSDGSGLYCVDGKAR